MRAYDLVDFARSATALWAPSDHWVPGAHAADFDDTEIERALPDSPFRSRSQNCFGVRTRFCMTPRFDRNHEETVTEWKPP